MRKCFSINCFVLVDVYGRRFLAVFVVQFLSKYLAVLVETGDQLGT